MPVHQRRLPHQYVSAKTVEELRAPWLQFFDEHPKATKDQILKLEKGTVLRFSDREGDEV
ncbi:MAG: hypothetical protein IPL73_24110 [Candidatus Obscuribacter sp.]|nr:hypothetical protein [Candidatus Obscuribacter sp.]